MPVPILTAEQQILQHIFSKAQTYDDGDTEVQEDPIEPLARTLTVY